MLLYCVTWWRGEDWKAKEKEKEEEEEVEEEEEDLLLCRQGEAMFSFFRHLSCYVTFCIVHSSLLYCNFYFLRRVGITCLMTHLPYPTCRGEREGSRRGWIDGERKKI